MVEELWSQPAGWACSGQPFYISASCVWPRENEMRLARPKETLHFLQIAGEIDTVLNSLGVAWSSLGTMVCYL